MWPHSIQCNSARRSTKQVLTNRSLIQLSVADALEEFHFRWSSWVLRRNFLVSPSYGNVSIYLSTYISSCLSILCIPCFMHAGTWLERSSLDLKFRPHFKHDTWKMLTLDDCSTGLSTWSTPEFLFFTSLESVFSRKLLGDYKRKKKTLIIDKYLSAFLLCTSGSL